jgi:phosphosulfolactate phosphohydrolase-like enzyme
VINVGDDGDVADMFSVHESSFKRIIKKPVTQTRRGKMDCMDDVELCAQVNEIGNDEHQTLKITH